MTKSALQSIFDWLEPSHSPSDCSEASQNQTGWRRCLDGERRAVSAVTETNQYGTMAEIVVGHVENIGSRCKQFGAAVETDADGKRTRLSEQ